MHSVRLVIIIPADIPHVIAVSGRTKQSCRHWSRLSPLAPRCSGMYAAARLKDPGW